MYTPVANRVPSKVYDCKFGKLLVPMDYLSGSKGRVFQASASEVQVDVEN